MIRAARIAPPSLSSLASRAVVRGNSSVGVGLPGRGTRARFLPLPARSHSTTTALYSPVAAASRSGGGSIRGTPHGFLSSLRVFSSLLWPPAAVPNTAIFPGLFAPARTAAAGEAASLSCRSNSSSILSWAIWLIKRTYQPSLLKKKRQCGFMKRRQSVGGRRIFKRRRQKGRKRLFGA